MVACFDILVVSRVLPYRLVGLCLLLLCFL